MRVLLIDDYDATARLFERLFREHGHETFVANEPLHAIDVAKQFQPDVVVTDISMPEMDGYTLAKVIKEDCGLKARIVALSGFPPSNDADRTRYIDAHLSKPVAFRKLLAAAVA